MKCDPHPDLVITVALSLYFVFFYTGGRVAVLCFVVKAE